MSGPYRFTVTRQQRCAIRNFMTFAFTTVFIVYQNFATS
jgi:hypothetical protein